MSALVETAAGLSQVVANWSLASGQRSTMAVATALLDHRCKQHAYDG